MRDSTFFCAKRPLIAMSASRYLGYLSPANRACCCTLREAGYLIGIYALLCCASDVVFYRLLRMNLYLRLIHLTGTAIQAVLACCSFKAVRKFSPSSARNASYCIKAWISCRVISWLLTAALSAAHSKVSVGDLRTEIAPGPNSAMLLAALCDLMGLLVPDYYMWSIRYHLETGDLVLVATGESVLPKHAPLVSRLARKNGGIDDAKNQLGSLERSRSVDCGTPVRREVPFAVPARPLLRSVDAARVPLLIKYAF
eukprot:Protomagalhaensia_wolfi_Nauph_80__1380@NODE_1827_length_1319_cov_153_882812_g1427_i0_p1_GENE_NODE_1827_length_1319_cov_153_882812_g1427_i0NODE_1827_length_1319_cov_153_882812_g1427_i0_p1_ORF_typecomplete_len255_score9_39_NODE_1827_length_1319_cov_153_882812_g1427_i0101865